MSKKLTAWDAYNHAKAMNEDPRELSGLRETVEREAVLEFVNQFFENIEELTTILTLESRTALGAELVLRELNRALDDNRNVYVSTGFSANGQR